MQLCFNCGFPQAPTTATPVTHFEGNYILTFQFAAMLSAARYFLAWQEGYLLVTKGRIPIPFYFINGL